MRFFEYDTGHPNADILLGQIRKTIIRYTILIHAIMQHGKYVS
jgi:hypothetical protein